MRRTRNSRSPATAQAFEQSDVCRLAAALCGPVLFGLLMGPGACRQSGGRRQALDYHGRDDWNRLEQIGPNASPSRAQVEAFVAMWHRVAKAIDGVRPACTEPYTAAVPLAFPTHADGT
jgi:hypothetical protein